MNTATVKDTQVHSFKLSEAPPSLAVKPPKSRYWESLRWRVVVLGLALALACIFSLLSGVVELGLILQLLPAILAAASVLGILEDVEKTKKGWRQEQEHRLFYGTAAEEVRAALASVEGLYPGRHGRLMEFQEAFPFYQSFMLLYPWEAYQASISPHARERKRRQQEGGFSSYITDDSWWSFTPRFLDAHTYELTVERYETTPEVHAN